MRNEEWGTGQPIVPEHLHPTLELINEEVRVACEEVDAATRRHAEAVLARIALASEATDQELFAAKEALNTATTRYVEAIGKRIAIADEINVFTRGQEFRPMAG